jgi:chitin synthase
MVGFSIVMAYTLFATIYLTVKSMEATISGNTQLLGDNVFTNVVLALLSTSGLYFLSSVLYMDPWHMFTSFLQFTLLLPSFVCTLQIYAFCNTYVVSELI